MKAVHHPLPLSGVPRHGYDESMVYDPNPMSAVTRIAASAQFRILEHDEEPNYAGLVESRTGGALVRGNAASVLAALPDRCIQTVVTSPPYWSLRDYGIPGQVGLEASVYDFIDTLADVFDHVHRVLRDGGTVWLNIGDSYTSGGRTWRAPDKKNSARHSWATVTTVSGMKMRVVLSESPTRWPVVRHD